MFNTRSTEQRNKFALFCDLFFAGGILSSALSLMCWLSLAAVFMPPLRHINFALSLYGGLLMFMGYVLYDTQVLNGFSFAAFILSRERVFCWSKT